RGRLEWPWLKQQHTPKPSQGLIIELPPFCTSLFLMPNTHYDSSDVAPAAAMDEALKRKLKAMPKRKEVLVEAKPARHPQTLQEPEEDLELRGRGLRGDG
ncbi:MAG: hypothetical protein EB123_07775, partial [Synechococcaceae bacterium WBB_32_011]|nr:hypothetical protein [Synechococcaceae bacterium WBB_32_011]